MVIAEAMVILWALNEIDDLEGSVAILSDALLLVNALNSIVSSLAEVEPNLYDILNLCKERRKGFNSRFVYHPRSLNDSTYTLAQHARGSHCTQLWDLCLHGDV